MSLTLLLLCFCALASPGADESLRIDGSSDKSAQQSYNAMLNDASKKQQQELIIAMIKLNMEGVKSAHELVDNKELQNPSIIRIKDRVDGMNAEEIIDLAHQTSDMKIKVQ